LGTGTDQCAICLVGVDQTVGSPHPKTTTLDCNHVFHDACLCEWAKECRQRLVSETCPLCRHILPNDYVTRIERLDSNRHVIITKSKVMFYPEEESVPPRELGTGSVVAAIRDHLGHNKAVMFKRYSTLRDSVFYASLSNTTDHDGSSGCAAFMALLGVYTLQAASCRRDYCSVMKAIKVAEHKRHHLYLEFEEYNAVFSAREYVIHLCDSRQRLKTRRLII
jgi:hypothetical protein